MYKLLIIIKAAGFFKYLFVKKGDYVYVQGSPPEYFYGVIRGKLSVRKPKFSESDEADKKKKGSKTNTKLIYLTN